MPSSAPPCIHTRSLHDALPIYQAAPRVPDDDGPQLRRGAARNRLAPAHVEPQGLDARELAAGRRRDHRRLGLERRGEGALARRLRSEEHTSELQSLRHLVCRLLHPPAYTLVPYTTLFRSIKLLLVYPMTTGRNFDEVLRVIDSLQLTSSHKVSTPVNWQQGDDVIIAGSVSNDEAKELWPDGWEEPKPYIRIVPQPDTTRVEA